jgi:hypothetical protein
MDFKNLASASASASAIGARAEHAWDARRSGVAERGRS